MIDAFRWPRRARRLQVQTERLARVRTPSMRRQSGRLEIGSASHVRGLRADRHRRRSRRSRRCPGARSAPGEAGEQLRVQHRWTLREVDRRRAARRDRAHVGRGRRARGEPPAWPSVASWISPGQRWQRATRRDRRLVAEVPGEAVRVDRAELVGRGRSDPFASVPEARPGGRGLRASIQAPSRDAHRELVGKSSSGMDHGPVASVPRPRWPPASGSGTRWRRGRRRERGVGSGLGPARLSAAVGGGARGDAAALASGKTTVTSGAPPLAIASAMARRSTQRTSRVDGQHCTAVTRRLRASGWGQRGSCRGDGSVDDGVALLAQELGDVVASTGRPCRSSRSPSSRRTPGRPARRRSSRRRAG